MISEPTLANLIIIPVYHFCTDNIKKTPELLVMMHSLGVTALIALLKFGGKHRPGSFLLWDYEIGTACAACSNEHEKYTLI
ncbi:uncharacterized protein ARMOST_22378 [Armillaria ostoyae]|uniref:Uncharacterized protein n=1 Tax=Armillaria ostoyae TaxID=47428 RepID=A0A284SCP3_ARMOS|nr:uncharacterized protein ARMOST_22378 [Armillaria ostoyae]